MARLTEAHLTLFREWEWMDVGMGYNFKSLEARQKLPRTEFRPLVRDLADEGYLELIRGCFTEDGDPYGSAYCLTEKGRLALEQSDRDGGGE